MRKMAMIIMVLVTVPARDCRAADASGTLSDYPKTIAALRLLYADHMKAYAKDIEFADKARSEKKTGCEALFNAMAASELIRAGHFKTALADLGVQPAEVRQSKFAVSHTRLNLKSIKNIRLAPVDRKYAILLGQIKDEKHTVAIEQVTGAWKVDSQQRDLISRVLSAMGAFFGIGARVPQVFYVCRECGCTVEEVGEQACPICQGTSFQEHGLGPQQSN